MWAIVFAAALAAAGLRSLPVWASAAACRRVQVPNAGTGDNQLRGVAVISARDAWAVGYSVKTPRSHFPAPLIEHWNGRAWRIQPSPAPHGGKRRESELLAVAATSSHDVWAVGYTGHDGLGPDHALIEHWNGRAWKIQLIATRGPSELFGVAATSSTNAWAVGYGGSSALIEHWNGRGWTVQTSPRLRNGELLGVTATSSRNAWGVGYDQTGTKTLIEHWNGRRWTIQASPTVRVRPVYPGDILEQVAQLSGVAATSSTNAWAVGYAYTFGHRSDESQMVIEHWNGRAWKVQAGADTGVSTNGSANQLVGVAATSSRNAWVVGSGPTGAVIQHRTGGRWINQAAPNGELFSVATAPSAHAWVVGAYSNYATVVYRTFAAYCR